MARCRRQHRWLSFTNLHNFDDTHGSYPGGPLLLWGNTLYGTAANGGANANGTVFAINTDGSGFTNLYNLAAAARFFRMAVCFIGDSLYVYGTTTGDQVLRAMARFSSYRCR